MKFESNNLEQEELITTKSLNFDFDIYDLYDKKSRINTLEILLCNLVKENKPIDDCLTALNYLQNNSNQNLEENTKYLTIWQKLANAAHEGFAIIGAFLFVSCIFHTIYGNPYSTVEIPTQKEQLIPNSRIID